MRAIASDEVEKRIAALLREARAGATFAVRDGRRVTALITPAPPPDLPRDLAFLQLKRHLARTTATPPRRRWTRRDVYARAPA